MSNITFDTKGENRAKKENIEWLRLWCEDTNDAALPRVALIGDSITEGYFRLVQKEMKGIALVDYLATSYSIDSAAYREMVKAFVADSNYAAVHYNYGLHAYGLDDETYESRCREMLTFISSRAKTAVGLSTTVLTEDLQTENREWKDKVATRNNRLEKIAAELGLPVNDLYSISQNLKGENRTADGVHFVEEGSLALAESVVASLKKLL